MHNRSLIVKMRYYGAIIRGSDCSRVMQVHCFFFFISWIKKKKKKKVALFMILGRSTKGTSELIMTRKGHRVSTALFMFVFLQSLL